MEIVVASSKRTENVAAFERFAVDCGCDVRVALMNSSAAPSFSDNCDGVVVFDDGEMLAVEWLARVREQVRYLSLPIVVIASSSRKTNTRLTAVGANAICTPDVEHKRILQEVSSHKITSPVLMELRNGLLGPFTSSTLVTMQELAATPVVTKAAYEKKGYKMFGDISAVIGLFSRSEGTLVLSFPDATAAAFARRVLGVVSEIPDDNMVRDCVGEIANVIAGQAKGILAGSPYQFSMSTPTIVSGAGHEIRHKPGMPCLVVAFGSDLGDFALQLCLSV